MLAILSSKIRALRNQVRVVEGDAMEEEWCQSLLFHFIDHFMKCLSTDMDQRIIIYLQIVVVEIFSAIP